MSTEENKIDKKEQLAKLKNRADLMGINYSPNIGLEKLQEKINSKLEETEDKKETKAVLPKGTVNPKVIARQKANKLVRVHITCRNPNKKEWTGEYITACNDVIGTIKKFVQFNAPFHVPQFILNVLKERQFQQHYTKKVNGKEVVKTRLMPEFGIEILPPISKEEFDEIAKRQLAMGTEDE